MVKVMVSPCEEKGKNRLIPFLSKFFAHVQKTNELSTRYLAVHVSSMDTYADTDFAMCRKLHICTGLHIYILA
jgi:hypothetical protein